MSEENEPAISIRCPHCSEKLKIDFGLSGQVVDCPHCAKQLTVPETPAAQTPVAPGRKPVVSPRPGPAMPSPAASSSASNLPHKTQNRPGNVITLEGPATPNLPLNPGESILLDISQGFRDLGLAGLILRHKGRLIVTTHRAIAFKKKTKDFDILQLNMRHAGFISLSHRLNFLPFLGGIGLILLAIFGLYMTGEMALSGYSYGSEAPLPIVSLVMLIAGLIVIFFSKVQALVLSGSGEKIFFRTKSVSADVLARVLTAVSANS